MITQEQIIKFANQRQTTEINIIREYYQHLFLSYFYQQPQASNIYFKGGTALRLIYKSPRFSEDLDFSADVSQKEIEQSLTVTLANIEKEGIVINLQEATSTSGGYLASILFQKDPGVEIRIEISLRGGFKKGELATINSDFVPSYTIFALTQDQLVDQKIEALLVRKKARDFYDLYFILRANLLPPQKKGVLSQALIAINQTDINFETELKKFLPKSYWAIIRDFKTTLEREINRFIQE